MEPTADQNKTTTTPPVSPIGSSPIPPVSSAVPPPPTFDASPFSATTTTTPQPAATVAPVTNNANAVKPESFSVTADEGGGGKKIGKKAIGGLFGIIILVAAVGAGVALVNEQQIFEQKAEYNDCRDEIYPSCQIESGINTGYVCKCIDTASGWVVNCADYNTSECPTEVTRDCPQGEYYSGNCETDGCASIERPAYSCDGDGTYTKTGCQIDVATCQTDVEYCGNGRCGTGEDSTNCPADCTEQDDGGVAHEQGISCDPSNGGTCTGSGIIHACDESEITIRTGVQICINPVGEFTDGANCVALANQYCQFVQIDVNDGTGSAITCWPTIECTPPVVLPSAPPSSPPIVPPDDTITAQCTAITAYDTDGLVLSATDLTTLSTGDTVRFAVSGSTTSGAFDKARFTINGTRETAVTLKNTSGKFYTDYVIPAGTTSFTISAELHHPNIDIDWF